MKIIGIEHIGIAVKDLSTFKSEKININNSQTCLEIFKKKQEFGGAYANLKTLNCKGNNKVDKNSILNFKRNEF